MAMPKAPALPDIPSRSAPEADFDIKMFALFKWATEDFVGFMEAWRTYLQTNSTVVGAALDGTDIGQTVPAAGAFTALQAESLTGDAVQSNWLDAAAGKLAKVGAFGWGHDAANGSARAAVGALADLSVSGLYRYSGDNPDAPSAAGVVMHFNRIPDSAAGGRVQLALTHGGRLFTRVQNGIDPVTYEPWRLVSPVGGSNSNGSFVRLPDGTQICRFRAPALACETVIGSAFMNDTLQSWVYPATFMAGEEVMLSGSGGASTRNLGISEGSSTSAVYRVTSAFSDSSAYTPSLIAIGRWE